MSKVNHQLTRADHRKLRVRGKISGSASRPRLSVFRSNKYTYLQAIDDENSVTLFSATESEIQDGGTKSERAKKITQVLVEKAKKAKVEAFVFDRGSYRYHGRVKLIAEAMREAGTEPTQPLPRPQKTRTLTSDCRTPVPAHCSRTSSLLPCPFGRCPPKERSP